MKNLICTFGALFVVSVAGPGCAPEASNMESEPEVREAVKENPTNAGQDAEKAAREALEAAKMAVMAAKLAVYSESQNDKEAAAQMASNAEAAAVKAQTDIRIINTQMGATIDENAKKAQELAEKAVVATREAARKTVESVEAGVKSDADSAKLSAAAAQKAVIRAASAAADASKAATTAATDSWEMETSETEE